MPVVGITFIGDVRSTRLSWADMMGMMCRGVVARTGGLRSRYFVRRGGHQLFGEIDAKNAVKAFMKAGKGERFLSGRE